MGTTVVLEDVKASELPEAWRRRVKAKANEVLTVTIAKRKTKTAAKAAKKPNATFGMWADRTDVRPPSRICVDLAGLDVHLLRGSSSSKHCL